MAIFTLSDKDFGNVLIALDEYIASLRRVAADAKAEGYSVVDVERHLRDVEACRERGYEQRKEQMPRVHLFK